VLRRTLAALALTALPLAALAEEQTPEEFLKAIYEPYKQAGFKGQPFWESKRFFVSDLAQAIDKDMQLAKQKNEVPLLDGDPFLDAQDWKVTSTGYTAVVNGDKAAAGVVFVNLDQPTSVGLTLAKTADGWRIRDIVTESGSLRALYKLKP